MTYMFLADGFETVEALCPLDLLRRAGVDIKTVGVTGRTVTSRQEIPVVCDLIISEVSPADAPEMVILPGGTPGAYNLDKSVELEKIITDAAARGAYIAAICAAPFILGRRGILRGRRAVCFPDAEYEEQLYGATLVDAAVVRDGNVITARAMGASTEFGLALVAALCGQSTADEISASIYYKK